MMRGSAGRFSMCLRMSDSSSLRTAIFSGSSTAELKLCSKLWRYSGLSSRKTVVFRLSFLKARMARFATILVNHVLMEESPRNLPIATHAAQKAVWTTSSASVRSRRIENAILKKWFFSVTTSSVNSFRRSCRVRSASSPRKEDGREDEGQILWVSTWVRI